MPNHQIGNCRMRISARASFFCSATMSDARVLVSQARVGDLHLVAAAAQRLDS